jgi:hypothetical protein
MYEKFFQKLNGSKTSVTYSFYEKKESQGASVIFTKKE